MSMQFRFAAILALLTSMAGTLVLQGCGRNAAMAPPAEAPAAAAAEAPPADEPPPAPAEAAVPAAEAPPAAEPPPRAMPPPTALPPQPAQAIDAPLNHIEHFEPGQGVPVSVVIPPPPKYSARLTDKVLREGHESMLSVAVSRQAADLGALLASHQGNGGQTPVASNGELSSTHWTQHQFIKAVARCPDFLECAPDDDLRAIDSDPMLWDFPLRAKATQTQQDGFILVKFYGAVDRNAPLEEIESMPALNVGIQVVHGLSWWEHFSAQVYDLLKNLHGGLVEIGAIVTLVGGWIIYLLRRRSK